MTIQKKRYFCFIYGLVLLTPMYAQNVVTVNYDNNGNRILKKIIGSSESPLVSVRPSTTVKYGQSVTLTATGCAGGTIAWSTGQRESEITLTVYGPSNTFVANCVKVGCPNNGTSDATVFGITGCASGDVLVTTQPGNWNLVSTWACGRIPTLDDEVYINHVVTLDGTTGNAKLIVLGGGYIIQQNGGSITTR